MTDEVIKLLDRVGAMLELEKEDGHGSRSHSIVLTHIDTAILWREKDWSERKSLRLTREALDEPES